MIGFTGDVELEGLQQVISKPFQDHEVGKLHPKIKNAGEKIKYSLTNFLTDQIVNCLCFSFRSHI